MQTLRTLILFLVAEYNNLSMTNTNTMTRIDSWGCISNKLNLIPIIKKVNWTCFITIDFEKEKRKKKNYNM